MMTQVDTGDGQSGPGRREAGAATWRERLGRVGRALVRPEPWTRGPVLAALALLLGLLMLLHAKIPNGSIGNLGSLVENLLPWFGVFVPVLLAAAWWRRSAAAAVALLLPVVVWLDLFGGLLEDKSHTGGDLVVAEQNRSWVLPATHSDHLPVAAGISW